MATNFFKNLYSEDSKIYSSLETICTYPAMEEAKFEKMGKDIFEIEIKNCLFNIGSLKAPGVNGFPALFYKSQWETIKFSFCEFIKVLWKYP